jgi:Xaa-Pro dipeptidase
MNSERVEQLKQMMDSKNLDALILSMPGHINMVSGCWPMNNGLACYVLPREGRPLCIVPHCAAMEAEVSLWNADMEVIKFGVLDAPDYGDEMEKILSACAARLGLKRIGDDLDEESFAPAWNPAEISFFHGRRLNSIRRVFGESAVVDISDAFSEMKQVKNGFEIELIRRANEIACMGMQRFREMVAPGVSGLELRTAVESVIALDGTGYQGAQRVRAFAQVSTGAEETRWGFRPMLDSTTRKMKAGDIALLELAVVVDGYWADRTEMVVAGGPSRQQQEIITLIKNAQQAVIKTLRPGMTCAEADALARDLIDTAGYGKDFVHITGHGVGFQYHDPGPFLMPGNNAVLQAGTVVTVEPGIYFEGFGGIRFEDDVVITDQGTEILGPLN